MEDDLFHPREPWAAPSDERSLTEEDLGRLLANEAMRTNLISYLQYVTKKKYLAEDLAQDVWIIIMIKIRRGTKIYASGLPQYAAKTGYWLARNAMRKSENSKPHEPLVSTDQETGEETEKPCLADPSIGTRESYIALKDAFNRLSDTEKRIFAFRYYGWNDQEIAQKLGLLVTNVRVIRYRAIRKIVKEMSL